MKLIQKLLAIWTGVHAVIFLAAMYIAIFTKSGTFSSLAFAEFFLFFFGGAFLIGASM